MDGEGFVPNWTLRGGPFDGQPSKRLAHLKVALGYEYGWTHSCGAQSLAFGHYTPLGEWVEPTKDRHLKDACDLCERYGTHDLRTREGGKR